MALKRIQKVWICKQKRKLANLYFLGTPGFGSWSTGAMQCGSSQRRLIPLAGHNHGTSRITIPRRRLLPFHPLSDWLPIQAAQSCLHHSHLPSEHQQQWEHLLGHTQIAMVTGIDNLKRFILWIEYTNNFIVQFFSPSAHFSVTQIRMIRWCPKLRASTRLTERDTINWHENGHKNMPREDWWSNEEGSNLDFRIWTTLFWTINISFHFNNWFLFGFFYV